MIRYTTGDVVDGQFELLQHLGQGGFGTVFRTRNRADDREYAFKFLEGHSLEKIQRELGPLRSISHPNVVHAHWAGQTRDGTWYIATDLVEGESLRDALERSAPMGMTRVARIGDQLMRALTELHPDEDRLAELAADELSADEFEEKQQLEASGIVHRDIKPENLIIDSDTTLVLVDFGTASRAGTLRRTSTYTEGYLPPDLPPYPTGIWDTDVDRYAAGVVLFECACGCRPNEVDDPAAVMLDPLKCRQDLDAGLAAFLCRACAPRRDERFATTAEMTHAWAQWARPEAEADDGLAAALPTVTYEEYTTWTRRPIAPVHEQTEPEVIDVLVEIVATQGPMLCWHLYDIFESASGPASVSSLNRAVYRAISTGRLRQVEPVGGGQQDKTVYAPGTDPYTLRALGPRTAGQLPAVEIDGWADWLLDQHPALLESPDEAGRFLAGLLLSTSPTADAVLDDLEYRIERRIAETMER